MTRSFLLTALMCSTLFLAPQTAHAAIDAAGAEAVKTMMKEIYDDTAAKLKAQSPNFGMLMTGDFKVTPKDTYYEVTSPHIIFNIKEAALPLVIDYGVDHINVMPGATPTQWRMASAMPSPIRVIMQRSVPCAPDAKKCTPTTQKTELAIHQKTAQMQILWDQSQKTALKINAKLDGFKFELDGKPTPVVLNDMTYQMVNTEKTPGIFDGQSLMSIKGLGVDVTPENCKTCKKTGKIGVGEIVANSNYAGFDLKKYNDFNQKMADMTQAGFDPNKGMSPQAFSALWSEIMKNGFDTMDSGKGDVTVRDVTANITDKDGKADSFSLKEFKYYGGFDGWRSDKANMHFGIDMGAMTLPTATQTDPVFKALAAYIPTAAHHKIELKNLPHRKLFEQMGSMAQNAVSALEASKCPAGTPADKCPKADGQSMQQAQLLGMQAMMTLPQLLAQAGTKVTMHVDADAPKSTVLVDGDFTANAQAIYSGVGKMKAVLGGLDAMIADLQTAAKDPTAKPADVQSYNNAAAGLTSVQMFGQQTTDAKGNPARTFEWTVDEKGVMKMNGADLSTFSKMGPISDAKMGPIPDATTPAVPTTPAAPSAPVTP